MTPPLPAAAEILAGCPLFASLAPARQAALAALAGVDRHRRGTVLLRQDAKPPGILVVGEGRLRVVKVAAGGKELVLHLAGPGATVAEVAVLEDIPAPAQVEVLETATCALLPAAPFRALLARDPDLARELLPGLAAWVRHFVNLLEDIVLRDAAGRVAQHLLGAPEHGPGGLLPRNRRQVALHLNLTPETLSRVLRRLQDAGLTQVAGGRLRIRDRRGLKAVADGRSPRL